MINFKKYIDKFIWFIGLIGTLSTCIGYKSYYIKYIGYINILLFLAVIVLLFVYFNSDSVKTKEVTQEELIKDMINFSKKLKKVTVYNPDKSYIALDRLNKEFIQNGADLSYIGDVKDFNSLLDLIAKNKGTKNLEKLVTNFSYEHMFIILTDNNINLTVIGYIINEKFYIIKLRDKVLNGIIKIFINRKTLQDKGIDLDIFENPETILKIINGKKNAYLRSFNELKSGAITFFGTEVQEVQCGWLENNDFKEINTLDLTTNPGIFSDRIRYNKANENYIKNDGIIKRVYMIQGEKLKDETFSTNLYLAIAYQKEIGVKIGLQLWDTLPKEFIQDFILYDNSIVLLENKQADKNYSIASSTAFFGKDKIHEFRNMFNDVWNGKYSKKKPTEFAHEYLLDYEKKNSLKNKVI